MIYDNTVMNMQNLTIDDCVREGMDAILQGQIKKALNLLDAAYYLFPEKRPKLWQRGIACCYGGRYEEGAAQFELDMEVNGCDVEEVLWHFICNCKLLGFSAAKERGFLQLCGDVTVAPMKDVLEMFEGRKCVADVIQAATPTLDQQAYIESYNGTNALAYAHFYCGMYCDVTADISAALAHFEKAADFNNPDFIGKLMKYHRELYKLTVYVPSLMPRSTFPCQQVGHSFSTIIQGGWKLSSTYSASPGDTQSTVTGLLKAIDCGITSMDCGDIYSGVEQFYGKALRAHCNRGGKRSDVQIFTKLVPDLEAIRANKVDERYTRSVVNRSLGRLGTSYLDLVQFHWWDCSLPQYINVVHWLDKLQQEGIIKNIGLTNFNIAQCQEIVATGVNVASVQIQYSLIDNRPCSSGLVQYCMKEGIAVLAYGVLAGGFITDNWLYKPSPSLESLSDRGLIKYRLIIEEFGGWDLFQQLLVVLRQIADSHSPLIVSSGLKVARVTIAMVAIQYILSRDGVKAIITTAHKPEYHQSLVGACHLKLTSEDLSAINVVLLKSNGVPGHVYELEQSITGRHGSIMKYNLNQVNEAAHLEELCERFIDLYFFNHPEEGTKMGYHLTVSDQHLTEDLTKFDYFKYSISIIRSLSCDTRVNMNHKEEMLCYISQMKALLHEVEGIKCEALNEDQLVDLQLIKSRVLLELLLWEELEQHKNDLLYYLPVDGILLLLPVWGGDEEGKELVHPSLCDTGSVYRSACLLSRLQALPLLLMLAEQSVHQPCREVIETTIRTCKHLEKFLNKEFPKHVSAIADVHLLNELCLAAHISAACVNKFCHYVRQNLLPASVSGSIVGSEVYKRILLYEHFIEDIDELLSMGETHFAEVKKELDLLALEISPGKSWQEVTKDVIRLQHPSAKQLLECYMSEIDEAKTHMFTSDIISPLPVDEKVMGFYTPEILRPFSPFGDFLNPSPFGSSNTGLLMLHSVASLELPAEEEERLLQAHDYTWIRVIATHECYPGHHIQMLCAQKNPRILRKFLLSVYFYEGWGLYTEELAYETGFYARELSGNNSNILSAEQCNKLTRLTQLRLRLWRAARVILDIKLNTGHMTFQECCQFLEREVMFDPSSSCGEVFMYLSRPGYAPCYLAGFVEIMKLRDQVKKKMGSKFNLKTFHNSLLSRGCLPFTCLRALLNL